MNSYLFILESSLSIAICLQLMFDYFILLDSLGLSNAFAHVIYCLNFIVGFIFFVIAFFNITFHLSYFLRLFKSITHLMVPETDFYY